jgi:hypothetical protein
MTTADQRDEEPQLHLVTVDDPRLWEFRSRLSDEEFAIEGLSDEEWDTFHSIIAEAERPSARHACRR